MVYQDFLRKAFKNPWVLQSLEGRHPFFRVPSEALHDEVEEGLALETDDLLQRARCWDAKTALLISKAFFRLV